MRILYIIFKKELNSYRNSPVAYVMGTMFLLVSGFFFYIIFARYSVQSMQSMSQRYGGSVLSPSDMIFRPLYANIAVLSIFVIPLLTMRLFAEEKRSGTMELLFTHPVKDYQVVLGKFLASYAVYLMALLITLLYPLLVWFCGPVEWGAIGGAYLAMVLLGLAFISFGVFASALTEHQMVAAVLSIACFLMFWVLGAAADSLKGVFSKILEQLSLFRHLDNLTKGLLDFHDVLYFLMFAGFCFYLTLQVLGSKKWRG